MYTLYINIFSLVETFLSHKCQLVLSTCPMPFLFFSPPLLCILHLGGMQFQDMLKRFYLGELT